VIIVDSALAAREAAGKPVRVGMIGAGFMARGIANNILNYTPGMRLVAVSNRTLARAVSAYVDHHAPPPTHVETVSQLEACIHHGTPAVTSDPFLLCRAEGLDVLIDVTGDVELGAQCCLEAFRHGKHMVLMNAEVDGTIGPILKVYADRAGVIVSGCDGDQPGVQMNLYRYVKGMGLTPLLCGNIKGLHDPYRTPTTQRGFAERWGQDPAMVTSFADGTKVSFEQVLVANATGMKVAKRGMYGYDLDGHVDDGTRLFDVDELKRLGGIVEYVVRAKPSPGVFVYATTDDPKQKHFLNLYKLGEGPLYSFYHPYHLCHFEAPSALARVVLFRDPVIQPLAGPVADVVATAKTTLKQGDTIDGLGGYMTYGLAEDARVTRMQGLLPIGIAQGARLKRDVAKDCVLTYDDVDLPAGRLSVQLRAEQDALFLP
jgi:predicted homoserine dehydrogenase-like protein